MSSWSVDTVVGTMALLAMLYAFPDTSISSAAGNSSSSSRFPIMTNPMSTREKAIRITMSRRPLAARSMAGPMKGAMTAKGAIVRTR